MTQVYEKTLKKIAQLKKNDPQLYEFFESLLYGKWGKNNSIGGQMQNYNIYMKRASQCVLYLHENHISLLVCIDKWMTGYRNYFNIKNVQILEVHSAYEMDTNLQKDKYLILKEKHEEVILLFDHVDKRNIFKNNLQKLRKILRTIPDLYDPLVLKAFIKADTNQNDEISWVELKSLVRMMKIDLDERMKQVVKKILKKDPVQKIYFSEFERMWKIFYCRTELINLFQKYNNQQFTSYDEYLQPKLDIKEFRRFLIEEQLQTEEEATRIIKSLYQRDDISLSFYDFCHYMFGPQNNLLNQRYKNEPMDTSKPLNHYHCYSSHNTYLTGDQLFSSSRAERYLVDLQNGLRCVEIDVHDSSDGPIVKHGYTPTPSVSFEEVIKSVRRFTLLQPNHTPIILSIQNHCNEKNQIMMAKILNENLAEKILKVNPNLKQFPSLKECIGKIIIKGPGNFKLFMENMRTHQMVLEDSCSEQQIVQVQQTDPNKLTPSNSVIGNSDGKAKQSGNKNRASRNNQNDMGKNEKGMVKSILNYNSTKYHQKFKVSSKLLEIICMLSKAKVQNLQNCHWQSISFSQKKIVQFFQDQKQFQNIKKLSQIKWFRSYPDGLRVWSSNYDPLAALQLGVQIVAINTQTKDDKNHHILKSFFMRGLNKTTGYRLKNINGSSGSNKSIKGDQSLTVVTITFISGLRIYQNENDSKSIPPVCIKAFFTGTQRDNLLNQKLLQQKQYTEVVQRQSFNPKFKKVQKIQIKCRDPELGFLVVQVTDCGRSVIPVDSMRPGWRVISLYDHELKEKQSRILCHFIVNKNSKSK